MTLRDAIPRSWLDYLQSGPVGVGMDIATTDGPNSNPASITVMQEADGRLFERLVISWKTRDEAVARQVLGTVLEDLVSIPKLLIKATSLDASNEVYFAQGLAKQFRHICRFNLVKGGENIAFQGQVMRAKELLGSLYVNAYTDGILAVPPEPFIKEDRRLVKKSKGLFVTDTGKAGKHGDTFDSGKLARWSLLSSGPAEIQAVPLSSFARPHHHVGWDTTAEAEDARAYLGFGEALHLGT